MTATIDGERVKISPHELPGEVEWRVDLLRWYVTKVVIDLIWIPKAEIPTYLDVVVRALVAECGLHPVEAELVTDTAAPMLQRFDFPPNVSPAQWQGLEDYLHETWDALQERYINIVSSSPQR
ncbi:conserved hypothetical protein [Cupriavidus taiwanensis]|uniref:hypothetical protein n=1 Tax=Cupriavidus taiwanensis TaxID=164546 RepID=UPI000E1A15F5|nr:hypothetical protein [Cupriavidus taiwanensis]SPA03859.1 conserved hypothetical protein [Cupriavidus taiwanensis]